MRLPDVLAGNPGPVPQPAGQVAAYEPPNWRQVGQTGYVLGDAAHNIESAANSVAQANQQQDTMVAANADNLLAKARLQLEFDPDKGFRNIKEAGAVGKEFSQRYNDQWQSAVQNIRDGLHNDNQRAMFDKRADVQGMQFQSALLQHQSNETQKFNDSTDNATINNTLQEMAARPTDDLNFATGLAKVNATIDAAGARKGLPAAAITELKQKYLDAAYSTRITSLLQGVPGVTGPDPKAAAALFKQVQDQMQPKSQEHLARAVEAGIQDYQARVTAQALIEGKGSIATGDQVYLGDAPVPLQGATGKELKADLFKRVEAARQIAQQQYPGDVRYADAVASLVEQYGRVKVQQQIAVEQQAAEQLLGGIMGTKPDGSDRADTIDQLLARPGMRQAFNAATPETRMAIWTRLGVGRDKGGSGEDSDDQLRTYYGLLGKAANDPAGFADVNLGDYIGKIKPGLLHELMGRQASINKQAAAAEAKDLNFGRAKAAVSDMLRSALNIRGSKMTTEQQQSADQFYGRYTEALQSFHDTNGKWPSDVDARKLAAGLLTQGAQAGGWLWDSSTRFFKSEDPSKFYVPLPPIRSSEYANLTTTFRKIMGRNPQGSELQDWYTKYRLAGGK